MKENFPMSLEWSRRIKKISEEKKIQISVYVEGIGTTRAKEDSDIGFGLGQGATGIPLRVREACVDIANRIKQVIGGKKLNRLMIDTYGFSRGAAAARHFVSEITKRKGHIKVITLSTISTYEVDYGALGEQLLVKSLELRGSFSVRFAGLYETVASYGIRHSNDTYELDLDAVSRAMHVFHLVAEDEHRNKFRLTNINKALALAQTKPEQISAVQKIFPGVHSDIGGGYVDGANDRVILRSGGVKSGLILKREKEHLISEGWYLDGQNPPQITLSTKGNGRNKRYTLKGSRDKLSNRYSFLPLHTMVEYSINKNIEFEIGKIKSQYAISIPLLKNLKTKLDAYVFNGGAQVTFDNPSDNEQIKELRNKYLHFSAHFGDKRLWGLVTPHAPNLEDGKRTRVIQDG
ncbi:T6SS phospholipase effector Tle1-like catalytic domain-containing protein [Zobellia nedashkovskayae]